MSFWSSSFWSSSFWSSGFWGEEAIEQTARRFSGSPLAGYGTLMPPREEDEALIMLLLK